LPQVLGVLKVDMSLETPHSEYFAATRLAARRGGKRTFFGLASWCRLDALVDVTDACRHNILSIVLANYAARWP
jgi:hypothetical protein